MLINIYGDRFRFNAAPAEFRTPPEPWVSLAEAIQGNHPTVRYVAHNMYRAIHLASVNGSLPAGAQKRHKYECEVRYTSKPENCSANSTYAKGVEGASQSLVCTVLDQQLFSQDDGGRVLWLLSRGMGTTQDKWSPGHKLHVPWVEVPLYLRRQPLGCDLVTVYRATIAYFRYGYLTQADIWLAHLHVEGVAERLVHYWASDDSISFYVRARDAALSLVGAHLGGTL